tara:strand:+ start:1423 stop:2331 length:909 start_codon:yes stop_codon:yes gene_type:complete
LPFIKKFDIFGLGCIALDKILFIKGNADLNVKYQIIRTEQEVGGLVGRALITASTLGSTCYYKAILGKNHKSNIVVSALKSHRVNTDLIEFDLFSGPIDSTVVISEDFKQRTIYFDENQWKPNRLKIINNLEQIKYSSLLIIDDYINDKSILNAIKIAKTYKVPILADFENKLNDQIIQAVKLIDHIIVSESFVIENFGKISPEKSILKLWDDSKTLIAITYGDKGCYFRSVENSKVNFVPSVKVKTNNTLGCGDVFHGAYAHALTKKYTAMDRIRFANAAAAIRASGKKLDKKEIEKIMYI